MITKKFSDLWVGDIFSCPALGDIPERTCIKVDRVRFNFSKQPLNDSTAMISNSIVVKSSEHGYIGKFYYVSDDWQVQFISRGI